MIEIISLKKEKPIHPWDVKVDRTTIFGNPVHLVMDTPAARNKVIDIYADVFEDNYRSSTEFREAVDLLVSKYKKYGKLRLFCWCAPKRCHAEVIRDFILEGINV